MQVWWNSTNGFERYGRYKKWDVDADTNGIRTETKVPLISGGEHNERCEKHRSRVHANSRACSDLTVNGSHCQYQAYPDLSTRSRIGCMSVKDFLMTRPNYYVNKIYGKVHCTTNVVLFAPAKHISWLDRNTYITHDLP